MNFIRSVGAKTLGLIQPFGSITLFLLNILAKSGTAFARPRLSVRQVYFAGVLSVLIVAVSGLFVGMVLGLQGYTQLSKFKSADILGYMVAASLLRELGPVLAAILFASSAGGAMTSEIGLMKTTGQLEAMNVMAVNPVARVVAPAFLGGRVFYAAFGFDFQRRGHFRRVFGRRELAGFGQRYFLAADAEQHYDTLRCNQRFDQIRRVRRGGNADCRASGLPLHPDFGRHFARQHAHGGFVRPDDFGGRFYIDRVDVYRLTDCLKTKRGTSDIQGTLMKKNILEFWVGLFVLIGAAAVAFLAFRVAGGAAFGGSDKTYAVYADFGDIGGLKVNAPVKSAGVLVGRVGAIGLDPKSYQARVRLDLDGKYQFSSDVSAQILTSGLLGEQYIGLQQGGDTENLAAGDTISVTSSAMVLENLIGKFMTSFAEKNAEGGNAEKAAE